MELRFECVIQTSNLKVISLCVTAHAVISPLINKWFIVLFVNIFRHRFCHLAIIYVVTVSFSSGKRRVVEENNDKNILATKMNTTWRSATHCCTQGAAGKQQQQNFHGPFLQVKTVREAFIRNKTHSVTLAGHSSKTQHCYRCLTPDLIQTAKDTHDTC